MPPIPAVDPDCCIGCEACTRICPAVFRMEGEEPGHSHDHDHGTHKAMVWNPTGAPANLIEQAMDSCPCACIYWQD